MLIVVQASGALAAFALSSALRGTPIILFGAIGLIIFLSFATIASGRGFLPNLLLLICFSTIPIVTMASPQQGRALPLAFTRGMAEEAMQDAEEVISWLERLSLGPAPDDV